MKLYSINSTNNKQVLKKNIVDLDKRINALRDYIDIFNANYQILNLSNQEGQSYYSDQQLRDIQIIYNDTIWPKKMRTHQIWDNTTGRDISISGTHKILYPGFALRHDGYNSDQSVNFSIIPLASSGAYYVLKDLSISSFINNQLTLQMNWIFQDNATDIYGLNYILSLAIPGSRFYFHPDSSNSCSLMAWTNSPIIIPSFNNTPASPIIATSTDGVWTTSHVLNYEIQLENSEVFEEVFDDSSATVSETRIGEYPQSRYTIITDMKNVFGDSATDPKLWINLY